MTDTDSWESSLGRVVAEIGAASPNQRPMQLLALFAARRALPCWQLYCDGTPPLDAVRVAERVLAGEAPPSALRPFVEPAIPAFRGSRIVDCRECDTGCAADAVAHMARLLTDGDAQELTPCLDAADAAFDQSPLVTRDHFRRWLIEVAVPAAIAERMLTDEEASRFREYSLTEIIREREAV